MKSVDVTQELKNVCSYRKDKIRACNLNSNIYISTENMKSNRAGVEPASCVPHEGHVAAYESGDILISNIRPYFKKIWKAKKQGGCSNDVLVFKAGDNVDKDFLYYVLSDDAFFDFMMMSAKGTKMPRGDKEVIMTYPVPIFSIEKQRKIASILSALDDKIETNNAICRNLEEQAMALFKKRFYSSSVQQGEEKPVYDFAEFINGAAFKQQEYGTTGLPIIKIAELKSGITSSTLLYGGSNKDEKFYIQNGDILFSWSGNPDTSIDVFIWARGDAILNQHIFNVKSRYGAKWFTYLMLKSYMPVFAKIAMDKQTTGLGHVTVADLKRLTFSFNLEYILSFEKEVSFYMEQVYNTLIENNTLSILRDTLLPKLMNGKLDLGRIKA